MKDEADLPHYLGFFGRQDRYRYDPVHAEVELDGATDIPGQNVGRTGGLGPAPQLLLRAHTGAQLFAIAAGPR